MTDTSTTDTAVSKEADQKLDKLNEKAAQIGAAGILPQDDPTRKRAEKTATPLSYEHLLLRSYLEQTFEINRHVRVQMRSLSSGAGEFILRLLSKRYGQEWSSVFEENARMYYLAASLQKMNDNPVSTIDFDGALAKGGEEAEKALDARLKFIAALPQTLMYLLYAHFVLFSQRVDAFIKGSDEELGNS